jgi:hypothetical protein
VQSKPLMYNGISTQSATYSIRRLTKKKTQLGNLAIVKWSVVIAGKNCLKIAFKSQKNAITKFVQHA